MKHNTKRNMDNGGDYGGEEMTQEMLLQKYPLIGKVLELLAQQLGS